jgi:hypothetical protein
VVYGAVALIVKMDDVGLHLARKPSAAFQKLGYGLVQGMPHLLTALSIIGTVAMLWVGGGIVLHGMEELGVGALTHLAHDVQHAVEVSTGSLGGVLGWLTYAALSGVVGLVLGWIIALLLHKVLRVGEKKEAQPA